MTKPVKHQSCPLCGHNKCLTYWPLEEGYSYKCLSCGSSGRFDSLADFYEEESFVPKVITKEKRKVIENMSEPYVPSYYRGISRATMENEGVYFTKTSDGKEVVHHPYPDGITKHRQLPKDITITGGSINKFQGQDKHSAGKYVTITEGEEDRLSVIEMMGDYPVYNLPSSTPSKAFWENAREVLPNFERIILSVDNDDAGNRVAKQIFNMFPGKVYRVNHGSYKDANDFLQDGAESKYRSAWWNAQRLKPENILSSFEDFQSLFEETPNYEYFTTGIPDLDEKMLGIHKGALTLILAETGIGKTELFRYLEYRCLSTTDYKIAFCHGEETKLRSILGLFSYHMDKNLITKDRVEEGGYLDNYAEFLRKYTSDERLFQFSIRVDEGVDEIVSQIRFLATAMEVDYIFIEPIQDFVSASSTTEKESLLTDLINKLKRLAPELGPGIVIIAHSNKEGEAKYAASIAQGAAYELRLKRDPDAEDPLEKNRTYIYIGRKNRTGGGSGPAGIMDFDIDSFTLKPYLGPTPAETREDF